jgi:acetylornithine deacetylase/succinyl-diaminopimelate desuccinylase-like protein
MPAALFNENIRTCLQLAAEARGARWAITRGHIGHDSLYLSAMGPAAMLFVRTDRGLSHCEEESAPMNAVLSTAGVFADAAFALANSESLADLPRAQQSEKTT